MAGTRRCATRRILLFGVLVIISSLVFLVTTRTTRDDTAKGIGYRQIMNIKNTVNEPDNNSAMLTADDDGNYVIRWDPNSTSWQLWKDSPSGACSQFRTRFALGLPRTYLVSFPGSGNTWVRYLLEAASGIFTGSVYTDREIKNAGYLGEADRPDSGRTIVQKSHGAAIITAKKTMKARYEVIRADLPSVLIIRNPAKAMLSYWKYAKLKGKGRHTKQLSEQSFQTKDFHSFVEKMTTSWEQLITDRLLWNSAPVHVVYYEQLVQDPIFHVKGMLEFLRVPADKGRLQCLEDHLQGSFKRPDKKEIDPYGADEKASMSYAVRRVKRLLGMLGYAEMPVYRELS
ncbi:WSC domain-containing protein 1-like [Penaeus monodon]|uniref:WSC domain-containing protein 1-like n=1 Tax=Penaeus monodon TaxID=6687 RepID=UPI0018A74409|nr:WSC domain-containing protein 1-like [Penaeus monodon]XP_037805150.1 WSC domain-containing protein 1-like [Penaeus monodon]